MPQPIDHPSLGRIQFPDTMSDAEIVSAIKKLESEAAPDATQLSPDQQKQFMASIRDEGTPNFDYSKYAQAQNKITSENAPKGPDYTQQFQNMGIRGAGPVLGTPFGPVGRGVGGMAGEAIAQFREGGKMRPGAIVGAGVLAALPIPAAGSLLRRAGISGAETLAAKAVETGIDEKRLPTLTEMELAGGFGGIAGTMGPKTSPLKQSVGGTEFRKTVQAAKDLGYVLPPSLVNPTVTSNVLESFAGKADTVAKAVQMNEQATTNAVRKELGLDIQNPLKGKPEITPEEFKQLNMKANEAYGDIAAVSDEAAVALEQYKLAQDAQRSLQKANYTNYTTERVNEIAKVRAEKKEWYKNLKEIVSNQSAFDADRLLANLEKANVKKAQIALAEAAVNKGTGSIDGTIIGRAFDQHGKDYLSGNFEKIGRVQQAFQKVIKDAVNAPSINVNKLTPFVGAGGASALLASGRPELAAAAMAAPFALPYMAQKAIFSKPYQQFLNAPTAGQPQDFASSLARFSTQSAGRNNPFLQPTQ